MRHLLLSAVIALLLPATAGAGTVWIKHADATPPGPVRGYDDLTFAAVEGEVNDVVVTYADRAFTVVDRGAPLQVGEGCFPIDEHSATCMPIPGSESRTQLALGDGDDRVSMTDLAAYRITGGDGNDRIRAAATFVLGEAGDDVLRGAFEADGGAGNDDVQARRAEGGPGNDRVRGSERAAGGPGGDVVVGKVALGGSGDDLLRTTQTAYGNAGRDVLIGHKGADFLDGGAGPDKLLGKAGPDALIGGPGRDRLSGGGARDVLQAADGLRDVVRCGGGSDEAAVDRVDRVHRSCERR